MKIERLKKNHRKEILIGGLVVLGIVSAITLVTTKAKYKLSESIPLVSGTINYKPYDFKTIAMYQSEDGTNYTEIDEMPSSGYVVNEEKTYCTTDNKTKVKGKIKTIDGNVVISNLTKNDKCYVWFDKKAPSSIREIILAVNPKDETPDFSQAATTDEGVYSVADGMYGGTSYYWRGAVTNNYVKFANFCWRIVRINGDGSIRLIYDGTTCHANGTSTTENIAITSQKYSASENQSNYVGWTYEGTSQRPSDNTTSTASNAKIQTETWFDANITGTNLSKVDTSAKFCNDRDVASGYTWAINPSSTFYYATYGRLYTTKAPTLGCPSGDTYTLKIGTITADEVMFAGGWNVNNYSYYLYNGQNYWTMSPIYWNSTGSTNNAVMFFVLKSGYLSSASVLSSYGLRPVINLKSDITFSDGAGTLNSPYVVS